MRGKWIAKGTKWKKRCNSLCLLFSEKPKWTHTHTNQKALLSTRSAWEELWEFTEKQQLEKDQQLLNHPIYSKGLAHYLLMSQIKAGFFAFIHQNDSNLTLSINLAIVSSCCRKKWEFSLQITQTDTNQTICIKVVIFFGETTQRAN